MPTKVYFHAYQAILPSHTITFSYPSSAFAALRAVEVHVPDANASSGARVNARLSHVRLGPRNLRFDDDDAAAAVDKTQSQLYQVQESKIDMCHLPA